MPPNPAPTDVIRARIKAGLVTAVAQHGYAGTTINDIVREAQISKSTFYAQFADKEACFLAAYDTAAEEVLAVMVEAADESLPTIERIAASTDAYFQRMAEDSDTARVFVLEALAAGTASLEKRSEVNERFAAVIRELIERTDDPALGSITADVSMLIVGGCNELVLSAIISDRLDELRLSVPDITSLVYAAAAGRRTLLAAES